MEASFLLPLSSDAVDAVPDGRSKLHLAAESLLKDYFGSTPDNPTVNSVAVQTLYPPHSNTGEVLIAFTLISPATREGLAAALARGTLGLSFEGQRYVAQESPAYAACPLGTVSPTGAQALSSTEPACVTCQRNTYANAARTACLACPLRTVAPPGSYSVTQCTALPTDQVAEHTAFRTGDEWIGSFAADDQRSGSLEVQVVRATETAVTLLVTANHGGECDTTRNCDRPGIAEYYTAGQVHALVCPQCLPYAFVDLHAVHLRGRGCSEWFVRFPFFQEGA